MCYFFQENEKRFGHDWTSRRSSQAHREAFLPSRVNCPQGRRSMSHTLVRMRGWWAVEVSSYKRVMGGVRRAQSSTCSPWLFWDIQFPVCQWQDVPCISSEEISTHSLCSGSQPHWCKKRTQSKYFQNSPLELILLLKAERLSDCSSGWLCGFKTKQKHFSTQVNRPALSLCQLWMWSGFEDSTGKHSISKYVRRIHRWKI